jgi:hypothetical protein
MKDNSAQEVGVAISRLPVYDSAMRRRSLLKYCLALPLLAALLFFSVNVLKAGETFPKPTGSVNDFAGVIPAQYKGQMENLARELLAKTGTAIVVATVETIAAWIRPITRTASTRPESGREDKGS